MEQQTTLGAVNTVDSYVIHNSRITTSEIAILWTTFQQYSMLVCIFNYLKNNIKDPITNEIITEMAVTFKERVDFAANTFQQENVPVPIGFTDADVNLSAPPIFSEIYVYHYIRNLIRLGLTLNSLNLNMSSRPDIIDFYTTVVNNITTLNKKVADIMLAKGIMPKPPYATVSQNTEYIHSPKFFSAFVGEKRPLLTIELSHLYNNALSNEVGKTLLLAFRQVSPNKRVRDWLADGMELSHQIVTKLTQIGNDEHIDFSFMRNGDVTNSTDPPFSDKLIMFHILLLSSIGSGMYGVSASVSMRHDIMKLYGEFMYDSSLFAAKGIKIMMDNDWFEEPPQVLDRDQLAEYKH